VGKESLPVALELQPDCMQEVESILSQPAGALNRQLQWRLTAGGATERLREARCGVGHGDCGTSRVDLALAATSEPVGND
jgi:hypothetical protein